MSFFNTLKPELSEYHSRTVQYCPVFHSYYKFGMIGHLTPSFWLHLIFFSDLVLYNIYLLY